MLDKQDFLIKAVAATFNRFLINTARRFVYPFAPALSRGMGVSLEAFTLLIAFNQIAGASSFLFGPLGDRKGYRIMMTSSIALLAIGMLSAGIFKSYFAMAAAMALTGLAKSIYDPAVLAYVGERVPYHRRGMIVGIIELGWAGSSLIGLPLMGFLIDYLNWQAPFIALGIACLIGVSALFLLIPNDKVQRKTHNDSDITRKRGLNLSILKSMLMLSKEPAAMSAMGFTFTVCAAGDTFFVVYGVWLEETFHLNIVSLGMTTAIIGIAELIGEASTAAFSDRLGKRRVIVIGMILSALSYIALPLIGHSLWLSLGALFLVFVTFELSVVTALSVFTELMPNARATMLSGCMTSASIGRVAGVLIGGMLWKIGGILAIGFTAAFISIIALILVCWIKENGCSL